MLKKDKENKKIKNNIIDNYNSAIVNNFNCNYNVFPKMRLRRLRKSEAIRDLLQETHISIKDLVFPLFIQEGINNDIKIESMPGITRFSSETVLKEVEEISSLGIKAIVLFGIPQNKDNSGKNAFDKNGVIQRTIKKIKEIYGEKIAVITDICLCQYTEHGHCGIIKDNKVHNDSTLSILSKIALSHSESGADIVAPSAMMDGQVRTIRDILDENGYHDTLIMGYSAKQASSFFSPFRDAAHSKPDFGNRHSYQMNISNSREAMREINLDIEEGADILMIKPAIPNLDLIYQARQSSHYPIAAYSVSGEYSMIKAAAMNGWIDEISAVTEVITAIKRAGADIIISYHAKKMAEILTNNKK